MPTQLHAFFTTPNQTIFLYKLNEAICWDIEVFCDPQHHNHYMLVAYMA